tara:strand:- start:1222 stop:2040 length:819 start_codon:yes stop_codon:yes gene_type:complete
MIKACIFDLGGTIVDRYSLSPFLSLKSAFHKNGINVPNRLLFRDMGKHKLNHIQEILKDPYITYTWFNKYNGHPTKDHENQIYFDFNIIQEKACSESIDILPGVKNIITYLQCNNIKSGSTTGFNYDNMSLIKKMLNENDIYIDSYVSSTCLKSPSRPDPSMIFKNMENLKIRDPRKVIKVDDTVVGIKEGQNAGCWTIGVSRWSTNMHVKSLIEADNLSQEELDSKLIESTNILLNSGADYVIDTLDELPKVIDDINEINSIYLVNEKRWI